VIRDGAAHPGVAPPGSMNWNDETDGARKSSFFQSFFLVPGDVLITPWFPMALQTRGAGVLRTHDAEGWAAFIHDRPAVFLALGIAGIGEHLEDLVLEIVRLVPREPIIDRGEFQFDAGLLRESLSGLSAEHGGDEAFEGDALLIDDGLVLRDHFLAGLNEGKKNLRMMGTTWLSKIDLRHLLILIHHLVAHIVGREAFVALFRVIDQFLMRRDDAATSLHELDQLLAGLSFIGRLYWS